jgi:hypothetical protein
MSAVPTADMHPDIRLEVVGGRLRLGRERLLFMVWSPLNQPPLWLLKK